MARRIHIKGIRRKEIDTELLGYVYFLEGKRIARQRRERAELAKAKQREGGTRREHQGEHHER